MNINRFSIALLILSLAAVGYLAFGVVQPFISSFVWSVLLAIVFYPVYLMFHKRMRSKNLASLVSVGVVLLVILGPLAYLFYNLVKEIQSLSAFLQNTNFDPQKILQYPSVRSLLDKFLPLFGYSDKNLDEFIRSHLALLGQEIISKIPEKAGSIFKGLFDFIIAALMLFFIFIHGSRMGDKILAYLPFPQNVREDLKKQVKQVVTSTVYGGFLTGLTHGILGVIAFVVTGIPSPVLLGVAVALTSFIPLVGSTIVYGAAVFYLVIEGQMGRAIILAVIGGSGLLVIDNFLRPLYISGGKMSFVLIFFGVLGGIEFFGIKGIVLGPLVLAIFLKLLSLTRAVEETASKGTAKGKGSGF